MNLVEVFQDTLKNSEDLLDSMTNKHTFSEINPARLTMFKPNISVINSDSVSALVEYSKTGKTCVLNMASYKRPGGGVYNGARAQEECLFRCSNLIHVVPNTFYPLQENEALFYYGNDQDHWRPEFPNPDSQNVALIFFHYVEPDHWYYVKGPDYQDVIKGDLTEDEWNSGKRLK